MSPAFNGRASIYQPTWDGARGLCGLNPSIPAALALLPAVVP